MFLYYNFMIFLRKNRHFNWFVRIRWNASIIREKR